MSKKDRRPTPPAPLHQPSEDPRSGGERGDHAPLADTDPRTNKTTTQNDSLNDTTPPIEALGRVAQIETNRPPEPDAPAAGIKPSCASCTYGQDKTLGGLRRCRANPPQAHFVNRMWGDNTTAGVHAIAMWPAVESHDFCGHWQNVDLS